MYDNPPPAEEGLPERVTQFIESCWCHGCGASRWLVLEFVPCSARPSKASNIISTSRVYYVHVYEIRHNDLFSSTRYCSMERFTREFFFR